MSLPIDSTNGDRFDDLVAGFVLGDLSFEEMAAIESLDQNRFATEVEKTDLAASEIFLTLDGNSGEQLPQSLRELILSQANQGSSKSNSVLKQKTSATSPTSSVGLRELASWFVAIAASVLVFATWIPSWSNNGSKNATIASAEQRRESLMANAPDIVRVEWQKPTETEVDGLQGDIVWSSKSQEGYMRLKNLARNNPTVEQYQLWIFDPERDEKPIDGGVFDIDKEGEVVVPIQAKLPVGKPTLFAITVEKPGGVVVSDRSRLPLLAKVVAN
ncbi:MAG: anti-sigma factor domain-containing protein [Pirellula sp.]|jgi:anti-sigma-K factor RskA|nr:anti-sigma factor [Pirellula sp.]